MNHQLTLAFSSPLADQVQLIAHRSFLGSINLFPVIVWSHSTTPVAVRHTHCDAVRNRQLLNQCHDAM